jgi:beta-glucosidase
MRALLFASVLCSVMGVQPKFPWWDSTLSVDQRVKSLITAMTLEEKVSQLGTDSPAIDRLAVPSYGWWSEASHGVAYADLATVFPASMGIGATFDEPRATKAGAFIGLEGRSKHNVAMKAQNKSTTFHGLNFFAPNINIVRDVRWGRAQETFGEDPHLTGKLGAAFIKGVQHGPAEPASLKEASPYDGSSQLAGSSSPPVKYMALATAKHFVAYNVDSDFAAGGTNPQYRLGADFAVSKADLRQTYFPAFREAIRMAKVASVMCAYTGVNGSPMCANQELMQRYG